MDASAVAMCRDNKLPIVVFNLQHAGQYNANVDGRARRHSNWNRTMKPRTCNLQQPSGQFQTVKDVEKPTRRRAWRR